MESPVIAQENTHRQIEVIRFIRQAVERGASDIHIVVDDQICRVKQRGHGELLPLHELTAQHGSGLCATIY
jgi:type II secretory ATPase GspE/PulE/Tfp pilus assembly ATPase PilB-like protein